MASIIKIKRSLTQGSVPAEGSLELGEIAVNLFDRKLYVGNTYGVGDTSGVSTIGGEDYRLTTQNAGGSTGAYLKLNGDSVLSTNSVLLRSTSSVTVGRDANGSISFTSAAVAGSIDTTALADGSVTSAKIAAKGIQANNIADGIITGAMIASNALGANTLATNSVGTDELVNGSVTTDKLNNGAVTSDKLGSSSVITSKIANKNVTAEKIADAAITAIAIAANALTANTIADGAIGTDALADGSVTAAKIANQGLTANTYGDNSIALGTKTTGNYVATLAGGTGLTVTGSGSETAAVTVGVTAGGIGTTELADASVTAAKIANQGLTSNTYADNSIALGTKTTGNYVATITGTDNEITVSGSGSETAAVTIGLPDDVTIGGQLTVTENAVISGNTSIAGDLVVDGDLTVEGGITYLSTSTVYTDDGMMKLSANNAADATDTGIYGMYVDGATTKYAGYFRDSSDEVFKFYKELQEEPTTTVNVSGTGYALAQLDAVIDGGSY
jgi:hypothetical protein